MQIWAVLDFYGPLMCGDAWWRGTKIKSSMNQGRTQDFHLGEGARKIMCAHAHHDPEVPYDRGPGLA